MAARLLCSVNKTDLLRVIEGASLARIDPCAAAILNAWLATDVRELLRPEICALPAVKRLGTAVWRDDFRVLNCRDQRFAWMVARWPRKEIRLYASPWLRPLEVAGVPVELRVPVRDGCILGVFNYHHRGFPADLLVSAAFRGFVATVLAHTRKLITSTPKDMVIEAGRRRFRQGVSFLADYFVTAEGQALWLECNMSPPAEPPRRDEDDLRKLL